MNTTSVFTPDGVLGTGSAAHSAQIRSRVLRNTYWLLSLSLLPTVLGAWLGLSLNLAHSLSGWGGMAFFLLGALGFMFAIEKTKNSGTGVAVLLGFTFFMGLMLSRMLAAVLGFSNGTQLIMIAGGGTAAVFFAMASTASVVQKNLEGMGQWLFWGAMVLLVGSVINMFVGSTLGMAVISTMALGIFSAFLLYDIKKVIDGGENNYITATLSIYLDLFNIFQSLLALLGIFGGERR